MILDAASREAITTYLQTLHALGRSPDTITTARVNLTGLCVMLAPTPLLDATHAHLAAWQRTRGAVITARSLRTQTSYIHGFYRWATEEGLLESDPSARLKAPKVPRLLPRPIAEATLEDVLDAADTPWMTALLALAAFAGLRACEIARLAWADVHLDGPEPWLRVVGKGSKERLVDLSDVLVGILRALPTRRGPVLRRRDRRPGHCTANGISKAAERFLKACEVSDTLHAFRHRFGTEVTRAGGLRVAQELMGHASPTSTAGYAQVLRSDTAPVVRAVGRILRAS